MDTQGELRRAGRWRSTCEAKPVSECSAPNSGVDGEKRNRLRRKGSAPLSPVPPGNLGTTFPCPHKHRVVRAANETPAPTD